MLLGVSASEDLSAVPGVVAGVLLISAAIVWFSPVARHRSKKLVLCLVIGAIARVTVFGYLAGPFEGSGAT